MAKVTDRDSKGFNLVTQDTNAPVRKVTFATVAAGVTAAALAFFGGIGVDVDALIVNLGDFELSVGWVLNVAVPLAVAFFTKSRADE